MRYNFRGERVYLPFLYLGGVDLLLIALLPNIPHRAGLFFYLSSMRIVCPIFLTGFPSVPKCGFPFFFCHTPKEIVFALFPHDWFKYEMPPLNRTSPPGLNLLKKVFSPTLPNYFGKNSPLSSHSRPSPTLVPSPLFPCLWFVPPLLPY